MTCLVSGGPANAVIVCEAMPITAKAIIFFIVFPWLIAGTRRSFLPRSRQGERSTPVPAALGFINFHRKFLLDFGPIDGTKPNLRPFQQFLGGLHTESCRAEKIISPVPRAFDAI